MESTLQFWVMDSDLLKKDDPIGEGVFDLNQVCFPGGHYSNNVPIFFKGKPAGTIYLEIQFIPDQMGGMGMNQPYPQKTNMPMNPGYPGQMPMPMNQGYPGQMPMPMNQGYPGQMPMPMNQGYPGQMPYPQGHHGHHNY